MTFVSYALSNAAERRKGFALCVHTITSRGDLAVTHLTPIREAM